MQLAGAARYRLGAVDVDPSMLEAAWPGGRAAVQPRAMQVLTMLAEAEGSVVSRDQLVAGCWDGRAVSEDAINRVIHLLRALAETSGGRGFSIQTIAKVGYRLVPSESAKNGAAAPMMAAEPRLAVLAFDNLTGDPDLAYFTDGVSEEILHTVLKTTGLKVVGRSSSFALRGAEKSASRVAAQLGVTHLLDGSVRRAGDRLRITAELVECATQTSLWSDGFDRPLTDVFALQDEIAAAVAGALNVAFAPSRDVGPIDPIAYDLYLRARDTGADRFVPHATLLEQATARAPAFAQAWALLAYSRGLILRWGFGAGPFAAQRAGVLEAAERALALDPGSGLAFLALATTEPVCGGQEAHRALIAKALAAAPNEPLVLAHAAAIHDVAGFQRRALLYSARAYELDPRFAGFYHGSVIDAAGREEEARALFDRDLARWPDVFLLNTTAMRGACDTGDWERYDAIAALLPAAMLGNPIVTAVIALAKRLRNWSPEMAEAMLGELRREVRETGTAGLTPAGILGGRGLVDDAYAILESASFAHLFTPEGCLPLTELGLNVIFTPLYRAMRRDVRFVDLCARLGLADFWARSGEWPDFAEEVAPFYDLKAEVERVLASSASRDASERGFPARGGVPMPS